MPRPSITRRFRAPLSTAAVRRIAARRPAWLLLGTVVAGFAGLSTMMSISLLPPSLHSKPTGFAVASAEMSVQAPSSPGEAPLLSDLYPLPQTASLLAEEMTSPALKNMIARQARIPPRQLAIDGSLDSNLQRTQQEPTEQKRSYQLLSEGDPYRITLQTADGVAGVTVAARAPNQAAARGLASATERAASAYLTTTESLAGTPTADRVRLVQLQPVQITGGSGGHAVAALVFAIVLVLWCGLVFVAEKLICDVRALRRPRGGVGSASPGGGAAFINGRHVRRRPGQWPETTQEI